MKTRHAFSLMEVMVALALGGVVAATVVATFSGALRTQGRAKHEWQAFTIAQQRMELLSAIPRDSTVLAANNASTTPGSDADADCTGIPVAQHFFVNELGDKSATTTPYELCWRVTDGSPTGTLKNIRVIVRYESTGGVQNVLLQTIR